MSSRRHSTDGGHQHGGGSSRHDRGRSSRVAREGPATPEEAARQHSARNPSKDYAQLADYDGRRRARSYSPAPSTVVALGRKRGADYSPSRQEERHRSRRRTDRDSGRAEGHCEGSGGVVVSRGFADATSAKGLERIRKRILGDRSAPFYGGPSSGPLTEANCAVFLEEKVRSSFRTLESGVIKLEPDVLVDGMWTTVPDEYTQRRIEMISEFLHDYLATRDAMDSDEPVEVWSVTGQVQRKQKHEVTGTDWLRLLVREQALTSGAVGLAELALEGVTREPNEAWSAAAARVVKHFRVTRINPDRPCASESQYFWRFLSELEMKTLFNRLADVLMPSPFERVGVSGLLLEHTSRISEELRMLRLNMHDPCGEDMVARGVITHRLFKKFADVLSSQSVSCKPPAAKKGSKSVGDNMFSLQELSQAFSSKKNLAALVGSMPAFAQTHDHTPALAAMMSDHVAPEPAPQPALPHVAAYRNQVASTPGQHGVPFESSARSTHAKPAQPPLPEYPPADASRGTILDYLRANNLCFARVFSGNCRRSYCRYSHDTVPAGFYAAASKEKSGPPPKRVVASLTEEQYQMAALMGLVDDNASGLFEADCDDASS